MGTALWLLWRERRAAGEVRTRREALLEWAGFAGASLLPDLDVVPGVLLGDMHGFHNQAGHSLLAGLGMAVVAGLVGGLLAGRGKEGRRGGAGSVFGVVWVSVWLHIGMDALTQGRGVRLFWPLWPGRVAAPAEVFGGLRWSEGLLYRGHWVTAGEELLFGLWLLVVALGPGRKMCFWLKKKRNAV